MAPCSLGNVVSPLAGNHLLIFISATTATTFLAILFMISWRYLQIPVPEPSDVLRYEPVLAVLRVIFRDSILAILGILGTFILSSVR